MIWKYSILHSKTVCSFPSAVLIEAFHLLVNFSNCWLTKVTSVREMRKVYELRKEEDFRKRFSINLWWSCQERFSLDKSIKAKQHTVEKRRHSAAAGWWHLTNLFFFFLFQSMNQSIWNQSYRKYNKNLSFTSSQMI